MPAEERSRTEDAYLKADSLQMLFDVHQDYIENILKIMDPDREPDIPDSTANAWRLSPDSLSAASEIEKEFIKRMEKAGYKTSLPPTETEEQDESEK